MDPDPINVYTDGACKNNGRTNAVAGIGVYFAEDDPRNVSQRIDGKQTNNTAELLAILEVFNILRDPITNGDKVNIYTDSEYCIRCATTYGTKLKAKNWTNGSKKIPNLNLVQKLFLSSEKNPNVTFFHIRAHTSNQDTHSVSNFHADRLANLAVGIVSSTTVEPKKNYSDSKSISIDKTVNEKILEKLDDIEKRLIILENKL